GRQGADAAARRRQVRRRRQSLPIRRCERRSRRPRVFETGLAEPTLSRRRTVRRRGQRKPERDADGEEPIWRATRQAPTNARLDGEADPWLLVEKTLLQHGFQEEPRIHDVDAARRIPLDAEFADDLGVLPGPIVQDQARDPERVLPLRLLEGEVAELDLEVALIGDRGVRRNEWTVSPGGPWHEQQC